MIKKMIALVMMLAMFTVQANASTNEVLALLTHDSNTEALKAAYDDLNYAMTVEWDQKDESFRAAEMKKFTASVTDLQAKGLSNTQLVEFAKQ